MSIVWPANAAVCDVSYTLCGNRFVATAGGAQATLDYQHELLTIRGKKLTLGTFGAGAQPVLVAARLGTDSRANNVRMVHKGAALRY